MRADVSLLLETVYQWVHLEADVLLLHIGGGPLPAQRPLESRVLALLRLLYRAHRRGDRRHLRVVLPASAHPLCRCWDSGPALRNHIRRLSQDTPELQWLEESPARWALLQSSVVWLSDPAALEDTKARTLAALSEDPRTAGFPGLLVLEFLAHVILDAPLEPSLPVRALDDAALMRVLSQGPEQLVSWAVSAGPARRALRRQAMPEALRIGLPAAAAAPEPVPPPAVWWPSQMLQAAARVVPFQGAWSQEADLLGWAAAPDRRSSLILSGPIGSGRRRLAHELRLHLGATGWATSTLGGTLPLATAQDQLVIVSEPARQLGLVRSLMQASTPGRLRVLLLAEGEEAWLKLLPGSAIVRMETVPPPERAARFRLAAASLARKTGRKLPWVMALPDLRALHWPLLLQLAALGAIRGRADLSPAAGALEMERRAWQVAGVAQEQMAADLVAAALGCGPLPGSYVDAPMPTPMLEFLVKEHLQRDPSILAQADPRTALPLLDRIAAEEPAARGWMRQLLETDPGARITLACQLVMARWAVPETRPLGGLLAELGQPLSGVPQIRPMRALTVHCSRQVLGAWQQGTGGRLPELEMAANAGGRVRSAGPAAGAPAPLAARAWELIRRRIDVLMPHQIRALDLLDQDHRPDLVEIIARQRVELQAARCETDPSAAWGLEGTLNDLGAMLLASWPTPEGAAQAVPSPCEATRQQARAVQRTLHEARTCRRARSVVASALAEAEQLLCGPESLTRVDADPLQAALELARISLMQDRSGDAAAIGAALLAPLAHAQVPRWPRRSALLGNMALLRLCQGRRQEARQIAAQAAKAAPASDHSVQGRLARIAALRMGACCSGRGLDTAMMDELLALVRALTEETPALYRPYLAVELDRAARWASSERGRGARRCEAVAAVRQLSSLNADLYAPFQGLSLHNLGAQLCVSGEEQAGTDATLDAAEAFRHQVRLSGETFLPDLAMTLSNLSAMLAKGGQLEPALALVRKSIGVCWGGAPAEALARMPSVRRLLIDPLPSLPGQPASMLVQACIREGTTRERPYFLWHLSLMAAAVADDGDDLREQVAAVWRFETAAPAQLRLGLATALHNLGVLLGMGGQPDAGAEALEGAAVVLRALHQQQPEQGARQLARALADLSALRDLLADAVPAEAAAAEALSLLPPEATAERAQALLNRSAALLALGRHQAAISSAAEAASQATALPAIRAAALHNLTAAALASARPTVAYDASCDALRAAPENMPAEQRALMVQAHQQAASVGGVPEDEAACSLV